MLSNLAPKTYTDVSTNMKVFDLDGKVVSEQTWRTPSLGPDTYGIRLATATGEFAESPTDLVFIRLTGMDGSGDVLGDTLYWHNWKDYMRYDSLNRLPEVHISVAVSPKSTVTREIGNSNDLYIITLSNKDSVPAVQTRIRTISSTTGQDILPTFYSDNYFSLMPGESKTITVEFNPKYLRDGGPVFELSGWNTKVETIERMDNPM